MSWGIIGFYVIVLVAVIAAFASAKWYAAHESQDEKERREADWRARAERRRQQMQSFPLGAKIAVALIVIVVAAVLGFTSPPSKRERAHNNVPHTARVERPGCCHQNAGGFGRRCHRTAHQTPQVDG